MVVDSIRTGEDRRLIWLASFVTCLSLAVVHGVGLIHRYRSYPTRVQLDVSDRQGIALPAVTVCPLDRFDIHRLEQLWRQRGPAVEQQRRLSVTEKYYLLAGVMSVDELWRNLAYPNAKSLFPMVSFLLFSITFYRLIFGRALACVWGAIRCVSCPSHERRFGYQLFFLNNPLDLIPFGYRSKSVTSVAGPTAKASVNSNRFGRRLEHVSLTRVYNRILYNHNNNNLPSHYIYYFFLGVIYNR